MFPLVFKQRKKNLLQGLLPQRTTAHPKQHESSQAVDSDTQEQDRGYTQILRVNLANAIDTEDKLEDCKKVEEVAVVIGPGRGCAKR